MAFVTGFNGGGKPIFPTTATQIAERLGLAEGIVEHYWLFDGSFPFLDLIGNADFNVDNSLAGGHNWQSKGGLGGGTCLGSSTTTSNSVSTTVTDVFAPGTDQHFLALTLVNGTQEVSNTNRSVVTTNGLNEGIRLILRNNTTVEYLNPTGEQQGNLARSILIAGVFGSDAVVNIMWGRTGDTTYDCWARFQGSGVVYHKQETILITDNFDENGGVVTVGSSAAGNLLGGTYVKEMMFGRVAPSLSLFDKFCGITNSGVTEV